MGRPMPGWDVAILDEDEQPMPSGERGEICLRARSNPHYPLGYWNNEEAARETFGGEWFHTKDAARMDEDGYVWYEGRADDVIIAAGYRIGPFEVESACLEHPAVAEAAAVASPDERRGSVVKAFVVLAEGYEPSDVTAKAIQHHVRTRLSAYHYPRLARIRHRPSRRRSPGRSAGSSCARPKRGACAKRGRHRRLPPDGDRSTRPGRPRARGHVAGRAAGARGSRIRGRSGDATRELVVKQHKRSGRANLTHRGSQINRQGGASYLAAVLRGDRVGVRVRTNG